MPPQQQAKGKRPPPAWSLAESTAAALRRLAVEQLGLHRPPSLDPG
ncbi:MAG TPA: hypothetical protein VLS96_16310 [Nodosilinea sp.]|nr:hypothetical protein [Nodosilinea sp.]